MLAPIAHIRFEKVLCVFDPEALTHFLRLSKIISVVLRQLYGIRRLSTEFMVSLVGQHSQALMDWRSSISSFLDMDVSSMSLLRPPFSRQCTVLNLAYSHAIVLVNRPLLLSGTIDRTSSTATARSSLDQPIRSAIRRCVEAAERIVRIVSDLCERQKMFGAFWVNKSLPRQFPRATLNRS